MLLALDIGNSRTKCFLFPPEGAIADRHVEPTNKLHPQDLADRLALLVARADAVCVASVVPEANDAIRRMASAQQKPILFVSDRLRLPFEVRYEEGRLGADRIAAAVGAWSLRSGQDVLVFDIGTAMTMGVILREGIFDGGLIAAGPFTAMRALGQQASQLMESVLARTEGVVAHNTSDALRAGFFHGFSCMIEGLVARVARTYSRSFTVLLTGGGAPVLSQGLGVAHSVEPNLVALGLRAVHGSNTS